MDNIDYTKVYRFMSNYKNINVYSSSFELERVLLCSLLNVLSKTGIFAYEITFSKYLADGVAATLLSASASRCDKAVEIAVEIAEH